MGEEKSKWWPLVGLFVIVVFIWLLYWYLLNRSPLSSTDRGTFGDMFGAISALFSGLAFAGVIYAIYLQQKELSLQRRELEATREELEGQKIQLQEQNKTSRLQRFENTFFQLLNLLDAMVENIDAASTYASSFNNPASYKGRAAFAAAYNSLRSRYRQKLDNNLEVEDIAEVYKEFYEKNHQHFGHFFRCLYHLLYYVNSSDIENKQLYFDLVRAQLDGQAILLIYYNAHAEIGGSGMKDIIIKMGFFKNIDKRLFLRKKDVELYPQTAFGVDY